MEKLYRILEETCPGVDFKNEKNLCDDGILTSFDIVAIVSEIMDEFDIEIDIDELVPENFNSADAMMELIKRSEG